MLIGRRLNDYQNAVGTPSGRWDANTWADSLRSDYSPRASAPKLSVRYFPLIDKSSRLITIQLIDCAEKEMDIITIGTFIVISVCLGIAAIMILEPQWIQISYVTWSRPKKLIFSTVMYLPLVFLLEGSWLILLPTFVFMSFIMLDRQKHFISFQLRT